MSTVQRSIRSAIFRPVSACFLAIRAVITTVVALSITIAGLSAPAFAVPGSVGSVSVAPASIQAPGLVPMQSTPSVQAGVFVPVQGRVVDTRTAIRRISELVGLRIR